MHRLQRLLEFFAGDAADAPAVEEAVPAWDERFLLIDPAAAK